MPIVSPLPGFRAAAARRLFFLSGKRHLAESSVNRIQLQSADTNLPSCEGGAAGTKLTNLGVERHTSTVYEERMFNPSWLPAAHGDDAVAVFSNPDTPHVLAQEKGPCWGHFVCSPSFGTRQRQRRGRRPYARSEAAPRRTMAAAVETEAQKYIRENGPAPREVPELDEALKEALRGPKIT